MSDELFKTWKKYVIVYVNLGAFVVLYGLFFTGGILQLPEVTDIERSTKLILLSVAATTVVLGIVFWDMIAGINLIEQKLKDIEEKIK